MTVSKTIDEMADNLIKGEKEKQEENPTLTVERGETTDLGADYDMVEVLHFNLTNNIENARRIIPMLSKKQAHRVLLKVMEAGIIEEKDQIKIRDNLTVNAFELCNQIEGDKRGLVLKVQEQSLLGLPDLVKQMKEQEESNNKDATAEGEGESNE